MRLHESDYIRLWYIAGLVQLEASENPLEVTENKEFRHISVKIILEFPAKMENVSANTGSSISIPPEDKTIFEGLTEVHKRFVELFAKYEFLQPQKEEDNEPEKEDKKAPVKRKKIDEQVKRMHTLIAVIKEIGEITPEKVEQESFGLFQSIPSAVDFYCNFQNIINLYDLIALLKRHPDIPLGRWILYNLQLLFNIGYVVKEKANYDYAFLNSAVGMSLHWLKKCLENREQAFTFEVAQVASPAGKALEEYLQEMCEIYSSCNRIHALALKDAAKENQRKANISKTKNDTPEAKARKKRNETIRQDIKKLKDSKGCSQHAACEKYLLENREFLKEQGINSAKYLEYICSGGDPNKQRTAINNGASIQTPLNSSEWKKFRKEYEEWRKLKPENP